jgi:rod shape-determining protein MreC
MLSRRAREVVLVASLIALPLLFLRANLKSPTELNFLDRAIVRVSAPLQSLFGAIARSIGGAWGRYVHLVGVEAERGRLVDENARLRGELAVAQHSAARVGELERLLTLRDRGKVPSVAARVVGAESSPFFRVLRIRLDRGEGEVKPGMPVLAADGVVGRVQRVAGPFCDVLLAVDPKLAVDVVVPHSGARGILRGVAAEDRYRGRIEYLLKKDEVEVGDQVVTSGIGGPFPRDLSVGTISKVTRAAVGLYQEADVTPAVDFGRLREVLVLLQLPPESAPERPREAGKR